MGNDKLDVRETAGRGIQQDGLAVFCIEAGGTADFDGQLPRSDPQHPHVEYDRHFQFVDHLPDRIDHGIIGRPAVAGPHFQDPAAPVMETADPGLDFHHVAGFRIESRDQPVWELAAEFFHGGVGPRQAHLLIAGMIRHRKNDGTGDPALIHAFDDGFARNDFGHIVDMGIDNIHFFQLYNVP